MALPYIILFVVAVVFALVGLAQMLTGNVLFGVGLIVLGLLVGPGGYQFFQLRERKHS
jgi:hypothetical protein